ncbi:MAG: flagellar type III secretion system protein FlhB [Pseudomonadota bacterium]
MAESQNEGQEKTLDPTPARLEQARRDGDVPKSQDVAAAAIYLGVLAVVAIASSGVFLGAAEPLSAFLSRPHELAPLFLRGNGDVAGALFSEIGLALAPLLLAPVAMALIALTAQRAIVVAPKKLNPQLSRISPISNAGQKFGPTGLVEFFKSTLKLCLIALVLGLIFMSEHDGVAQMMGYDGRAIGMLLYDEGVLLLSATLAIATAIAIPDYLWQRYDHARKLRMSFQDLKDETKEHEGDPYMKQTRQARAREIATNKMLLEVPKADVVVVNPTHYAVALKWSRAPGAAPVCVAKGVDEVALRIRRVAEGASVPIHSDPPTARALHAAIDLGREIRPEHYQAVAAAIRFAEATRQEAARRKKRFWGRAEETAPADEEGSQR